MPNTNYSQIIGPEEYNSIINEHLYITNVDNCIKNNIEEKSINSQKTLEVVELGCGPARLSQILAKIEKINLTCIDIDTNFLAYAQKIAPQQNFVMASAQEYVHNKPVDIFVSQGMHHHIPKGEQTQKYLKNVIQQLDSDGIYIIGDEFLPDYRNERERQINAIVWYSHIIGNALNKGYEYLL